MDSKTVRRSALCRSRRELSHEHLFSKFGFGTAENEPPTVWGGRVRFAPSYFHIFPPLPPKVAVEVGGVAIFGGVAGLIILGPLGAVTSLVERFDIDPYSDFSSRWSNFIRLVLCCIDAKICKKIFVGKLLSLDEIYKIYMLLHRSDLNISEFFRQFLRIKILSNWQKFAKFNFVLWNYFHWFLLRFCWNFVGISPII